MLHWNSEGAARVLAQHGDAILLERAEGGRSLATLARNGQDDEVSRIICGVVAKLHAVQIEPFDGLTPLAQWFRELGPAAARHGGILLRSLAAAGDLIGAPQNAVVLHGDIHHDNILDFGARGWLAGYRS